MSEHTEEGGRTPRRPTENENGHGTRTRGEARDGLQMPPEVMLDLARTTAELVVERIASLPRENAWEGDFRRELEE